LEEDILISEFSRWLNDKKITLEKITAEHERAFLRHRARHRHCPKPGDPITLEDITKWIRAKAFVIRRASDPAEESEAQGLMQELSFPKIRSRRIRKVRQNQRIIVLRCSA
jgi:hypothetical protein